MIELETAIDKTKDQMKRIIAIMQEVSFSQQVIEQRVQKTQVIQEDSSAEYVGLLEEVKVETLQEAEFVAQQHHGLVRCARLVYWVANSDWSFQLQGCTGATVPEKLYR